MRRVALITPGGVAFTKQAARDCLDRGEAPLTPLLANTVGLAAEDVTAIHAMLRVWQQAADVVAVYAEDGVTAEMQAEIDALVALGLPVEMRDQPGTSSAGEG